MGENHGKTHGFWWFSSAQDPATPSRQRLRDGPRPRRQPGGAGGRAGHGARLDARDAVGELGQEGLEGLDPI